MANAPAIDPAITPRAGFSRGGQPLSYNRAPAADLAPWIGRFYATYVDAPADHAFDCGIFNDCSMARVQLRGDWVAETADGTQTIGRAVLLFGPQTRVMRVAVTGGFTSIGFSFRPGTGFALSGRNMPELVDRLVPGEQFGWPVDKVMAALDGCEDGETAVTLLEGVVREFITAKGAARPDPLTVAFELISLTNPARTIADCARDCGVDRKQLERVVLRDFGMSPKQVLRRARALDMAAHLRGVADEAEAPDLALRYYDQSHLIREFSELFGISPRQFVARPLPILTLALESRQAQRLQTLARLAPGAKRPWQ
ncbi:MAG: hypothetical protein RLZZ08_1079 [Pseudomonadota bacterium]